MIIQRSPTGSSNTTNWNISGGASHHGAVSDNGAGYIIYIGDTQSDIRFTFAAISVPSIPHPYTIEVKAITTYSSACLTFSASMWNGLRISGVNYFGTEVVDSTSVISWKNTETSWFNNPATGVPWTLSDIGNIQNLIIKGLSSPATDDYMNINETRLEIHIHNWTKTNIITVRQSL